MSSQTITFSSTQNLHNRTILFALDESSHSVAGLNWVFDDILVSEKDADNLVVIVVVDKEGEVEQTKSRVTTLLRAIHESHSKSPHMSLRIIHNPKHKPAGEIICDVAREVHPHILVLGSAGKSHVQGLWVGSVSNYAIQHAPCPVIVARMTQKEETVVQGRRLSFVGSPDRRSTEKL